jgi:peptidoglycan hydrolase-like protein with peptidoglycan-binding domain
MGRTLRVGCWGADVAAVQDALNQIGANAALPEQQTSLPLLVPDGVFGNKTLIRVKDFQHTNGLDADGVVGPATLGRLRELLPAVQAGMSTSRPAGGVPEGRPRPVHPSPIPLGGGKTLKSYPGVYDPDPFDVSGSKTSTSGSKTSSSGSKTSKA